MIFQHHLQATLTFFYLQRIFVMIYGDAGCNTQVRMLEIITILPYNWNVMEVEDQFAFTKYALPPGK